MRGFGWIRHALTGLYGEVELGRLMWAAMCVNFMAASWIHGGGWPPIDHATGGALLLGAGGVGIGGKDLMGAFARAKLGLSGAASPPPPPTEGA